MTQNLTPQAGSLPGLTKLYLLQLYPLALVMLCARFALAAVGLEGGIEPLIWAVVFFCFGAASLAVIAGIHLRAEWAPKYAAHFNLGLCLLLAAGFARVLAAMRDVGKWGYSFDEGQVFMAMGTAALAMYIPIFFAWRRYFVGSRRLLGAFGLPQESGGALPPAGMGVLQTLSASFLLFYLAFFLSLAISGGGAAFSEGGYILLVLGLPPAAFLAALLGLSSSPGKKQKPLLFALVLTSVFMLIWSYAPSYIVAFLQKNDMAYSFYGIVHAFGVLPMSTSVMCFLAAILAWKIWADPKEQAWFADGQSAERAPAAFSLYNIVLLHYAASPMFIGGIQLVYLLGSDAPDSMKMLYVIAALSVLLVLLHSAALYNRTAKRWNDKALSLSSFAASGAFSLFITGLLFKDIFFGEDSRPALYSLLYNLPLYLGPVAAALVAMLHWRAVYAPARTGAASGAELPLAAASPEQGFFTLKGPRLAFALFCILLMTEALSKKAAELCAQIFLDDGYYFVREGGSLTSQLLNLEFWGAYLVCPLLALKWLAAGCARLRNFCIFSAIWVCAMLADLINNLLATISRHGLYDFNYSMITLLDSTKQIYIYTVILFMVYLASARRKTADGPETI